MKNMTKSFKNIYERLNEVIIYLTKPEGCFCTKSQVGLEEVDFKSGVKNFSLLKASNNGKRTKNLSYGDCKIIYNLLVKKESILDNNLKSTNNRTNFTKLDDVNNQLIFKSVQYT